MAGELRGAVGKQMLRCTVSFYEREAKYGGLAETEARRLRSLEGENRRLKKLLTETMLDVAMMKDIASKRW